MTQAQLISAASGAALLAHRKYNVDRQRRVDVFDILKGAASEVFFRPLKKCAVRTCPRAARPLPC
jgi:hypothetical protein